MAPVVVVGGGCSRSSSRSALDRIGLDHFSTMIL